jgi:hypothetical protein
VAVDAAASAAGAGTITSMRPAKTVAAAVQMAISLRERRREDGGCAGGTECLIAWYPWLTSWLNLDRRYGAEAPVRVDCQGRSPGVSGGGSGGYCGCCARE